MRGIVDIERRREALQGALQAIGVQSLSAFLEAFPGETYFEIAGCLGSGIAPIEISRLHMEEASRGDMRAAAADSLVRELRHHLAKSGWVPGPVWFELAHAFGSWSAHIKVEAGRPDLHQRLAAVLSALVESRPPAAWLPASPHDPFIEGAFQRAWPRVG